VWPAPGSDSLLIKAVLCDKRQTCWPAVQGSPPLWLMREAVTGGTLAFVGIFAMMKTQGPFQRELLYELGQAMPAAVTS
jgi:hypothetical protein